MDQIIYGENDFVKKSISYGEIDDHHIWQLELIFFWKKQSKPIWTI
jgi:hypothetical protein